MVPSLSVVATSAAVVAVAGGVLVVARRLERLEHPEPPPVPESQTTGRKYKFGAYQEPKPNPVATLISTPMAAPGGAWILAGLALAIGAVALAQPSKPATAALSPARDSVLVQLRTDMDTLRATVGRLRDSLRITAVTKPASNPAGRGTRSPSRIAARTSQPAETILPAAPPPPLP
ncbi:MAG TPA: hypothetical protein VJN95_12740 [Gemmatimonadales bacterium]|nr:hypothetical protein [Gemmatimonadales bacterium]